jgi:hypothetical protein
MAENGALREQVRASARTLEIVKAELAMAGQALPKSTQGRLDKLESQLRGLLLANWPEFQLRFNRVILASLTPESLYSLSRNKPNHKKISQPTRKQNRHTNKFGYLLDNNQSLYVQDKDLAKRLDEPFEGKPTGFHPETVWQETTSESTEELKALIRDPASRASRPEPTLWQRLAGGISVSPPPQMAL